MFVSTVLMMFPFMMAFAAASDIVTMKISNSIAIVISLAFAIAAVAVGMTLFTVFFHLLTGFVVLSLTFGAFAMGWMGGGDAKLMAATALWFGPTADLVDYILIGSVFGGVLTLGLLAARGVIAPVTGIMFVDRLLHPETGIPYGVALGLAGLTVFSDSAWIDLVFSK